MSKWLLTHLLPYFIAPLYWLLAKTWRLEERGPPQVLENYVRRAARAPCVYAHWHGDELVLVAYYSFRKLAVLSSLSKDGSLMARTLELLGYRVFRGSSSKGGARGLIGLIRAVKEGAQSALAVDGPKGPIYEVKPGVIELARRTGQPIIPVRTRCDRAWYIPRAWNHSYIPRFFARVTVEYGQPMHLSDLPETTAASCEGVKIALDAIPGQPPAS